jgi:hypothetical protein
VPLVVERLVLPAAHRFIVCAGGESSALLGLSSRLFLPAASLVIQLCSSFLRYRIPFLTLDQAPFTRSTFARSIGASNKEFRFSRDWFVNTTRAAVEEASPSTDARGRF